MNDKKHPLFQLVEETSNIMIISVCWTPSGWSGRLINTSPTEEESKQLLIEACQDDEVTDAKVMEAFK